MAKHIPSLKNFISSLGSEKERADFAEKCGSTLGHLRQIYYGNRSCDAGLAIEIEKNANQTVKCEDLRKDIDFSYLRSLPVETTEES